MGKLLRTDYLTIGSGLVSMAFAYPPFTETDANSTIVDRYAKPGGHRNLAYPFVTLHRASSFIFASAQRCSVEEN